MLWPHLGDTRNGQSSAAVLRSARENRISVITGVEQHLVGLLRVGQRKKARLKDSLK